MILKSVAEATSTERCIRGVVIKELNYYPDDRGFFCEIIRHYEDVFAAADGENSKNFGQWSHSKMGRNTVKAWHFHHKQIDWWYCGVGVIHTVLYDLREESPTFRKKMEFKLGDRDLDSEVIPAVVRIPPGVAHGLKVVCDPSHLFYITSNSYDPQDEGRYPFNSDVVPHDWGDPTQLVTSERDRKLFIPTHTRVPI